MGSISINVTVRHKRALPLDEVAPQHNWIDEKLSAWGRWSRLHLSKVRCGSAEGAYRAPWRQWVYPSYQDMMPQLPHQELRLVDRAVLRVPEQHRTAIRLHYVFMSNPHVICRKLAIPPKDFGRWMHDSRCMTLNNIRLLTACAEQSTIRSTT